MANTNLPLKVSSKSTDIELGGPITINPFANAGVTAEDAPVLFSLEADYVLNAESFASRMVKSGGQGTAAQARLALNGTEAVIEDLVDAYGAVSVQTPLGTIETFVAGTVEHAQAQPDPTTNYAFLGIVVPEAYRKLFASIETTIPSEVIRVSLKRVRDKATAKQAIFGTGAFYLKGRNMNYGETGTKLELQNYVTRVKVCDVAVDATTKSLSSLVWTLPATTAVPTGTYWLELTAKVGDKTCPVGLKVEVAEAVVPPPPVPTIAKVVDVMHLDSPTDHVGGDQTGIQLSGENLALAGYQLTMEYRTSAEAAWQALSSYEVAQATVNKISLTSQATAQQLGASDYRFTVTNSLGTATRTVAISA